MKKIIALLLGLLLICSLTVSAAGSVTIYLSPDGSDTNPGTYAQPVATLQKAFQLAKGSSSAMIWVMEGNYHVTDGAEVLSDHVTVQAYQGAKVTFTAENSLPSSSFRKVTDQATLDRIVEKSARSKLVVIDLKEAGVTKYGAVEMTGFGYPASMAPRLLVNGNAQTLARYPDNGYMMISKVVEAGTNVRIIENPKPVTEYKGEGIKIQTSDARPKYWKQAKELFMYGYFMHDWAEAILPTTIDYAGGITFCTEYPSYYGVAENRRFYCFNLLEEISRPGEWFLDRETGLLYLYPEHTLTGKDQVEFITFDQPFLTIRGRKDVTLSGLSFGKSLDRGIVIEGGKQITVTGCEFSDIAGRVIDGTDCTDCRFTHCTVKNVGERGFSIAGGDRATLTPGNNVVSDCVFEGFSLIKPTLAPAIQLDGVGNTATHNRISNGQNSAIMFSGNNHVIEYNDIFNVCTDTADAGAIYSGRDWAAWGNEIRYNYIHDIVSIDTTTKMNVQAIYLDDMYAGGKVYGNVIYKVPSVALYGGGRYNTFENNIVLECEKPFVYDARGTTWMKCGEGSEIRKKLEQVPYQSDIWKAAFPELAGILEDEPQLPKHSVIRNNLSYRTPDYKLDETMVANGTVEQNLTLTNTKDFVDYRKHDFTLRADSEIFTKLPDFKPIDFKAIGPREAEAPAKTAEELLSSGLVLKVNEPKLFVFGREERVDPQNRSVVPLVRQDRTLVPVRVIAESLGGTVTWDEATQTVGIVLGDRTVSLQIDRAEMTVNGGTVTLDVPAQVISDRTMLPLRAVAESLGMTVYWDEAGSLIVISKTPAVTSEDSGLLAEIAQRF